MSGVSEAAQSVSKGASGGSQVIGPDVIEAGRVLAQLDDWRAITFVLVFVIVVLLIERFFTAREIRLERKEMTGLAREYAANSGKAAEAMSALRQEVMAFRLTTARVESIAASTLETSNVTGTQHTQTTSHSPYTGSTQADAGTGRS